MGKDSYHFDELPRAVHQLSHIHEFLEEVDSYGLEELYFRGMDGRWYDSLEEAESDYMGVLGVPQEVFMRYRSGVELPPQDTDSKYEPEMGDSDVTGKIELDIDVWGTPVFEASVSYPLYIRQRVWGQVPQEIEMPEDLRLLSKDKEFIVEYRADGDVQEGELLVQAANETFRVARDVIDVLAEKKIERFFPPEYMLETQD